MTELLWHSALAFSLALIAAKWAHNRISRLEGTWSLVLQITLKKR
jgi:hypothetical protein